MSMPLKIKRPKKSSLSNEILVGAVIFLPLIYLFYLHCKGMRYHFDVPAINLMAHILFFLIPFVWVKIFFSTKLEFDETGETVLDQQSTLIKLKNCWWMMLMIWSPLILCAAILAKESRYLLTQGIPDFSSSPGSLFWTLVLIFALGVFYRETIRSGYILSVSEHGVRTGLSSFCEWENVDHIVCQGDTFSIYHNSCKYLPYSGFKLNDDNTSLFKAYVEKHNILTTDRHHPALLLIKLSVIAATLFMSAIGFYLYNQARIDVRWLVIGIFVLSILATMLLEKIRGISKVSKIKPQIEEKQRSPLEDSIKEFPEVPKPEIISKTGEDAFVDLVFGISRLCVENNVQTIFVSGRSDEIEVGFSVELGENWESGGVGEIQLYVGTVRLASTGNESDSFIHALARVYGVESTPGKMSKSVEFSAISLDGNPADLASGPVKLKLFFDPDDDGYAEVYATFDLGARKFYFNEKDPEYRPFILRALSTSQG